MLIYLAATHVLALVFATSGLAKIIQGHAMREHAPGGLDRIARMPAFAWLQTAAALILLCPAPMVVHAACALLLTAIIVTGFALRFAKPQEECECLGSLTPHRREVFLAIGAVALIATVIVVLNAVSSPFALAHSRIAFTAGFAICIFGIERKLRYDQLTGQGYVRTWVDVSHIDALPGKLVLGADSRGILTTDHLAQTQRPSLILVISSHCGHCVEIYKLLMQFSGVLSAGVNLVVIAQNDDLYRRQPNAPVRQLIDTQSRLSRFLGLRMRPYALYVGTSLNMLAPPSQSSDAINRLLAVLMRALKQAA